MSKQLIQFESRQFPDIAATISFFQNSYGARVPPRGLVWLVHGLGEYIGRYGELCAFLNQAGFDVIGVDLPGHGESLKFKHKEFFSITESLALIKEAFRYSIETVYAQGKPEKWYLLGHSMGALIALTWTMDSKRLEAHEAFADKLVVSAPPLALRLKVSKIKRSLAEGIKEFLPDIKLDAGFSSEDLCRDHVVVEANRIDPKCFAKASPHLFLSMENAAQECLQGGGLIDIPTYFITGDSDPIVQVETLEKFYNTVNCSKKFLKLKGGLHESFNEINRRELMEGLVTWLCT